MQKYNVLIFPAGSENAINIHDSLKYNIHFNLFGASSNDDYGKEIYKADNYCFSNLYINDKNFIDDFNNLLVKFKIDFVIPTHDTIALYLMNNESKINAKIVCSPFETTKIANDKNLIFTNLKGKWYLPKTYNNSTEVKEYPIFLKPYVGAGGKGTYLAKNKEELEKFLVDKKDILITEYLPGDELTIDCFTDKNGKLLFVGPRTRERITIGISFMSKTVELTEDIKKIAEDLNKTFIFRGAWFFQLKKDKEGLYKIMEFSVRQAGTMALYRELGINFTILSLFDIMDMDVEILFNNYPLSLNRRLKNSYQLDYYYDKVYIDFDDTIIINNKVNSEIMSYLYQCLNKNKKVILITKHSRDIYQDLDKYHIDNKIFNKIFELKNEDNKTDFIDPKDAIFIDNYYIERKNVFNKYHIPVFDVDAIECLIDYSEI